MRTVPPKSAQRLIRCYYLAQEAQANGELYLTSRHIASLLGVDETQVRKDMATIHVEGVPKRGYPIDLLIERLEHLFGIHKERIAVLVGVGNLGKALMNYPRFFRYGVRIACAFERDPQKCFTSIGGVTIYPVEVMKEMVAVVKAEIGILAIPPHDAQEIATLLLEAGVKGIWNFSPVLLRVPAGVVLRNECLETGLVTLLYDLQKEEVTCNFSVEAMSSLS